MISCLLHDNKYCTSLSLVNHQNYQLAKGKRRRTGSETDGIGSLVERGHKYKLDHLSSRNLFHNYNVYEFELTKRLKVFDLQTKGKISRHITFFSNNMIFINYVRVMFLLRKELIKSLKVIKISKIAKIHKF